MWKSKNTIKLKSQISLQLDDDEIINREGLEKHNREYESFSHRESGLL
jgi:hypothetical protein